MDSGCQDVAHPVDTQDDAAHSQGVNVHLLGSGTQHKQQQNSFHCCISVDALVLLVCNFSYCKKKIHQNAFAVTQCIEAGYSLGNAEASPLQV